MGQDSAPVSGAVKVGPLGCLGLVAALGASWAIGRAPTVFALAAQDTAAAAPALPRPVAAPVAAPAAPQPIVITMPAAAPAPAPQIIVVREGGGGTYRRDEPAEVRWTLPLPASAQPAAVQPAAGSAAEATAAKPATAVTVERSAARGTGFAVATLAYADLAVGDRRAAADKFAAALALEPASPNAPAWQKELKRLRQRWSGEGYVLLRDNGTEGLGTRPVLGGGQTGVQLAYTPRPLARRPVYAVLRATTTNSGGFSSTSGGGNSQIAAGVKWQVLPQLSVSGERLFAVAHSGRSAFTVRVAGGIAHRFGPVLADAYAEGGVVGFGHPAWFTGAQGRAAYPLNIANWRFEPGIGVWSGVQRAGGTIGRVDLGPTLGVAWDRWKIRASADYRVKVAGNARPGSGPAVTVSGAF